MRKPGAQEKAVLDAAIDSDGENYVSWGGSEGHQALLNSEMKREKERLAIFLHATKGNARQNGFKGSFFIGAKPCEPSRLSRPE